MSSARGSKYPVDNIPKDIVDSEATRGQSWPNDQRQRDEERHRQMEIPGEAQAESTFVPWRIFINHMDSYHGKGLARSLPEREYTVDSKKQADPENIDASEYETENEEEEEEERKNKLARGGDYGDDDSADVRDENRDGATNFTKGKVETTRRPFEVIGTVKDSEYKRPEDVSMVIRTTKNKELLLRELMKCGVVIYDITQDDSQIDEAQWALEAIVDELVKARHDTPKAFERSTHVRYFILISTVMTWAMTKPLDPEDPDVPFTEADYRKRKPHPNFKEHIKCEREVSTISKRHNLTDKLKTVVLGSGITYGDEEGPLHYLFKMAWKNADYLPIFGNGSNQIPLLHVRDLVEIVCMLIKKWPKSRYIVGVEQELVSQAIIVKKISKALTIGKVERLTPEESFLLPELSQRSYDMLNAHINITPGYILDNELQWYRDTPFRDNIDELVEEYKKSRNLYPVKIIVLGPPASGKTRLAQRLAEHYELHYLCAKSVIDDTIRKLSEKIEAIAVDGDKQGTANEEFEDPEEEEDDDEYTDHAQGVDKLQAQLSEIRENMAENKGRLGDDILNKIFLERLVSKDCQNQGYVIDGYPKTLSQAQNLFDTGEDEEDVDEVENDFSEMSVIAGNKKILPELVIVLEADDEFLINRVIRRSEKEIEGTHYNEDGMLRRLMEYRNRNTENETPVQFFDEREIHPLVITIKDDPCPEMFPTFAQCIKRLGEPRNYGPSDIEREETKKRFEAEALAALKIEAARKERENFEKKMARERKMMEWTDLLEKLKQEEEEQMSIMVEPLRHYLVNYIFPTLTKGLIEVSRLRPEDPIDFLAEYLFKENPEGKMFEPDYTETMSMLLDAIEKLQEKIVPTDELDSGNERYLTMQERRGDDRVGKGCRSSEDSAVSTDGSNVLDADKNGRKSTIGCAENGTISGIETINADNGMRTYVRDSDTMVASSFSYEQIAEGSRKSYGNSTNISLEDSR